MKNKKLENLNEHKNENTSKDYLVTNKTILLDFLLTTLKGQSRNNIKNLLTKKYVLVNGSVVSQYNYELANKDIVSICKNPNYKTSSERYHKNNFHLEIIYEDERIIVINKPAGLLSIASDNEKVETAYRLVLDYLKKQNVHQRVYVTHRIDKETSGVLLFSKDEKLRDRLQDKWNEIVTKRGYYAIVKGKLEKKEDTIINYLFESKTNLMYVSDNHNGKKAITKYKVMKENSKYSLLDVNIDSGRKNQIRVAFANLNHPLIGDDKYGDKFSPIKRLGLHAYELDIKIDGKQCKFFAKIPNDFKALFKEK